MRLRLTVVSTAFVLSAFALSALAQDKELISAPSPQVHPHVQGQRSFDFQGNGTAPVFRHYWYWEVTDFAQPPLREINRNLPQGAKVNSNDYMPAALRWNFEGKRKVVPTIDLTVMEIRPGEKTSAATSATNNWMPSSSTAGILWTKATHSISDLLHY